MAYELVKRLDVVLTFNEDSTYNLMDQGTIPLKGTYHITLDTTFGESYSFYSRVRRSKRRTLHN
jgi:hypothetical protein